MAETTENTKSSRQDTAPLLIDTTGNGSPIKKSRTKPIVIAVVALIAVAIIVTIVLGLAIFIYSTLIPFPLNIP